MARLYVRKVVAITSLCIAIFLCFRFPQGRHKGQAIKGQWRQTTNRKCGQARPSSRCGRCYTVGEGRRRLSKLNGMSETFDKTMTSPHVLKQVGTPLGPSIRSIWAWWYIEANFDASFTIMSVSAISTYVLHILQNRDYSTTADYYRVYGLAQRMLYSYPFLPDSFRFPLPSSWCNVHQL